MNRKLLLIAIISIFIFSLLLWSQKGSSKNTPSNTREPSATSIPTATPTPINLNKNTSLNSELDKLDPESFNEDFKILLIESNNL